MLFFFFFFFFTERLNALIPFFIEYTFFYETVLQKGHVVGGNLNIFIFLWAYSDHFIIPNRGTGDFAMIA